MHRHSTKWLNTRNDNNLNAKIETEMEFAKDKFGRYNSMHEAYAVIKEELEEFWDGVKVDDPDPSELLQVVATAKRALIELCESGRGDFTTKGKNVPV